MTTVSFPNRVTSQASFVGHLVIPVLVAGLAALIALVVRSPHHYLYDEIYFASYVPNLKADGFGVKFLNSLPGAPGPLYAIFHAAFEPFTQLDGARIRLVNMLVFVALMIALAGYFRFERQTQFVRSALLVLVVPMTWVVAGLALTEMPSMFLATLSLVTMLVGLRRSEQSVSIWACFLLSAVFLGAACWGRQSYIVLLAMPAIVAIRRPDLRIVSAAFAILSAALVLPLFAIWHGTVPPSQLQQVPGWSLPHGLWGLSYSGMAVFLLAPQFFVTPIRWLLAGGALAAVLNAIFSAVELYPVRSVAQKILPIRLLPIYGNLCGTVIVGFGLTFLGLLVRFIWENKDDSQWSVIGLGLLLLGISPLFIGHQYSSRYTVMALPFFVLFASRWQSFGLGRLLLMIVGMGFGSASLYTYLFPSMAIQ